VTADGAEAGFGGLRGGDAVVGVAHGDGHAARLGVHLLGDREAGGVVLGAVDAQAGGEALQRGVQRALRSVEVTLGVERSDVGVDDLCHFASPSEGGLIVDPGVGFGLEFFCAPT